MSGAQMVFTWRDAGLQRELRNMIEKADNQGPFLRGVGDEMYLRINERFDGEHGPDGEPWAPHSPVTIGLRLKRHGNAPLTILNVSGALTRTITYQIDGPVLSIGTGASVAHYAGIHQFGGKAGRGRKVTIPARPYLGWGADDTAIIEEEAEAYFLGS